MNKNFTEITVRASSWPDLFDCPARWYAKNIEGKRLPTSGAAHVGTSLHAGTAAFDTAKLAGNPISADDAAEVLVKTLFHPEGDVDWDESGGPEKIEPIALTLHTRYCTSIAPTRNYLSVESECDALDIAFPDQQLTIRLTGTTDRVRTCQDGRLGISDLKSGSRAVGSDGKAITKGHALQLAVYELLAEKTLSKPIEAPAEIIGMQTTTNPRVGVNEINSPRDKLIGDEEHPGMLEHAAALFKSGLFYGNSKSMLCTIKYCPVYAGCRYHD